MATPCLGIACLLAVLWCLGSPAAIGAGSPRQLDVLISKIGSEPRDRIRLCVFEAIPEDSRDTYGSRLWPAAVHLATYLTTIRGNSAGTRVLELGCGNGLCSLAAAGLGFKVLATDYRQGPLDLLCQAAEACAVPLQQQVLDFAAPMPSPLVMSRRNRKEQVPPALSELPSHDLLLAADVGYSKALAWRLGERCRASLAAGARILVCESRQMPECRIAFREALNLGRPPQLALRLKKETAYVAETQGGQLESVPYVWFLDAQDH